MIKLKQFLIGLLVLPFVPLLFIIGTCIYLGELALQKPEKAKE